MKIVLHKIINKHINILFYFTPFIYAISKILDNKHLYALKDVFMFMIFIEILIYLLKKRLCLDKKRLFFVSIYFSYIIIISLIKIDDFLFWTISIRELLISPLLLIFIGIFLSSEKINFIKYSQNILLFTCFLTVLFSFMFPRISYGFTGRLISFWDREHESSIIGGLTILSSLAILKENKIMTYKKILLLISIFLGLFCIIKSESRSTFVALILSIIFLFSHRLKIKNIVSIICIFLVSIFLYKNFNHITHRSINYNLIARTSQYSMAIELIKKNPLFGIGIDKYGILSGKKKEFMYNGISTTTMDSTLLKYTVNLGLSFFLLFLFMILNSFRYSVKRNYECFSIILFGLMIGSFTGKLGAYPMNQYFYVYIGYMFVKNKNIYNEKYKFNNVG